MESHVCNRLRVTLACVLLIATADVALAQEIQSPPDRVRDLFVEVYTEPTAAVVEAGAIGDAPGAIPTKSSRGRKCRLEPDTANVSLANTSFYAAHPDETSFYLYCDGQYVGLVWRKNDPGTPRPAVPPEDVAMNLREEIPMPQVSIRANPAVGLAGSESWFWVEGYSGAPITRSTDAFGRIVEVEAGVTRYEWAFGDGVTVAGSLGRPYPERSDIRHTYERSSARSGDGYAAQVRFVFSVRYRIDGSAWVDLPGITRTASFRYPVQESQAVISR